VLAGEISDGDRRIAEKYPYVTLTGYVSHEKSISYVLSADLLFLPMHDLPPGTRAGLVPGKTYEYLGSGRPILAAVPDGDARDLLAAAGSASLCRPADVQGLKRALQQHIELWQSGGTLPGPDPLVIAQYERRALTEQLAGVFDTVLGEAARDVASRAASDHRTKEGGGAAKVVTDPAPRAGDAALARARPRAQPRSEPL